MKIIEVNEIKCTYIKIIELNELTLLCSMKKNVNPLKLSSMKKKKNTLKLFSSMK